MRELAWREMICSRSSEAWSPDDGLPAAENVARFAQDRVLRWQLPARIYHRYGAAQGYCAYDVAASGAYQAPNTTTNLPAIRAAFEAAAPVGLERLSLGQSYEGRPIYGYRLGSPSTPHVVITAMVHGNEGDGHPGTYTGFELLLTHPDFAPLREQFTLFMVPELNPDGYYHWTRGLAHQVDGKLINLNRCFDWFWNEYLESSSESKGLYPEHPAEAQALTTYWRTGNSGGKVPFACLMDVHGTEGDGYRYQSRERLLGQYDAGDHLRLWFDWWLWRHCRALQAKRVREDGEPDLYINYFRSRFRPHLHPYFQTRTRAENAGVPPISMVIEHNKVQFVEVTNGETYASACNLHVDYITSMGLLMQGGAFEAKPAVLVEGFTATNLLNNAHWGQWQPDELRPSWFSSGRCLIDRAPEQFLQRKGEALELTTDLELVIPGAEACRLHGAACSDPTGEYVYYYANGQLLKCSQKSTTGNLTAMAATGMPASRVAMAMPTAGVLWVIGGGSAYKLLEMSPDVWGVAFDIPLTHAVEDVVAVASGGEVIIAGGQVAGVTFGEVYKISAADALTTEGTLGTAVAGACGFIDAGVLYVVGGWDSGGTTLRTVQRFDLATGSALADLTVSGDLADGAAYAAGWMDDAGDVWLYGGFHRASDPFGAFTAIGAVHKLDRSTGVWAAVELFAARYDEEDMHDSDSPDRIWSIGRGGWAAAALRPEDEPGEWQVYVFGGGPDEDDSSTAVDEIRVHDVRDDRFVRLADSDYGYIRKNVHVDAVGDEIAHDDFTHDSYAFDAGMPVPLTLQASLGRASVDDSTQATWADVGALYGVRLSMDIDMDTVASGAGFQMYLRSHSSTHYMLAIDENHMQVLRVNPGSQQLADVATITLQPGRRTYAFTVCGSDPVTLELQIDGASVWSMRDYDAARRTPSADDDVVLELNMLSSTWYLHDLRVEEALYDQATFAAAVHTKAVAGPRAPHVRMNLAAADAFTGSISARRCRNYYLAPPQREWWWLRGAIRLGGQHSELEHELRWYCPRVYKDAGVLVDAPMLCRGLRPSSWMPEGGTRAAEHMTWPAAVDLGHLQLELDWLPTVSFLQLEQDTELLRIEGATAQLQLWACVGTDLEAREYNRNDVYGPVEPALEWRLWTAGGGTIASCRVPVYWGTMFKDTVRDLWDDHLHLVLRHKTGFGLQLEVGRDCALGRAWAPLDAGDSHGGRADLVLVDGGYWAAPEVGVTDGWQPVDDPNGALLVGDRDPTWGKVDEKGWNKGYQEDFNRADDANLGSMWDRCLQLDGYTEYWQVQDSGAELHPNGHAYERWDAEPGLARHLVTIQATLNEVDDEVGLLLRMDASDFYAGKLFGYKVTVTHDGSDAIMTIHAMWHDGSAQQEELLATAAQTVASGTFLGGSWALTAGWPDDRDTLEVEMTGVASFTVQATDLLFRRPGAVGIFGKAEGASPVRIDAVSMNTVEKTEITE